MSIAPSGVTVARARYWLAVASRVAGIAMVVVNGPAVVVAIVVFTMGLFGGGAFGDLFYGIWNGHGAESVRFVLGIALLCFARPIAAAVTPLVKPVCPRCGYSRSGLLAADPCPECGTRSEADTAQSTQQRARRTGEGA